MQTLIYKIPNTTTLKLGVFTNQIPVFFETTFRIAHSMCILALYQWLSGITFGILLAIPIPQIHGTVNIGKGGTFGTFVLRRPATIGLFHPLVALLEVRSHTGFVAQRPDNDRRMIKVSIYIVLVAFDMCFEIERKIARRFGSPPHSVRLDIRFGYHVQTILIAQIIPARIVGIMRSTNSIDIELFQYFDILQHAVVSNVVGSIGIHLMTVHTFYQHRLAIDQQLSVLDFYFTKAHFLWNIFYRFIL